MTYDYVCRLPDLHDPERICGEREPATDRGWDHMHEHLMRYHELDVDPATDLLHQWDKEITIRKYHEPIGTRFRSCRLDTFPTDHPARAAVLEQLTDWHDNGPER